MKPKISIIVPVYKVEPYIHKCIDSILNQTFKDFELILVDDGSPDNCGKICDEYAQKDERIVVIHKDNGGQATARNAGIDIARGDYIGFVDSDDWIEADMYELLYESCSKENSDIVIIGVNEVNSEGKIEYEYIPDNITLSNILKRAHPCNKLFSIRLFKENDLKFADGRYYEDLELIPKLYILANIISTIDASKYNYLHRENSTTSTKDNKVLDYLWAYKSIKAYILQNNLIDKYGNELEVGLNYFKNFYLDILHHYPADFKIKNFITIFSELRMLCGLTNYEFLRFLIVDIKIKLNIYNKNI